MNMYSYSSYQFNNVLVLCLSLSTEVDCDPTRVWCPMPGCETIVQLGHSKHEGPQSATCQACTAVFCAKCSLPWHPATPCLPHPAETLVSQSCSIRSISQSEPLVPTWKLIHRGGRNNTHAALHSLTLVSIRYTVNYIVALL